MDRKHDLQPDLSLPTEDAPESPRHGFQGNRAPLPETPLIPAALTVAISREAGSRGGSIARRAGRKLDWQVYNQELLEYMTQEANLRDEVAERLAPAARQWVDDHIQTLLREQNLSKRKGAAERGPRSGLQLGVAEAFPAPAQWSERGGA